MFENHAKKYSVMQSSLIQIHKVCATYDAESRCTIIEYLPCIFRWVVCESLPNEEKKSWQDERCNWFIHEIGFVALFQCCAYRNMLQLKLVICSVTGWLFWPCPSFTSSFLAFLLVPNRRLTVCRVARGIERDSETDRARFKGIIRLTFKGSCIIDHVGEWFPRRRRSRHFYTEVTWDTSRVLCNVGTFLCS